MLPCWSPCRQAGRGSPCEGDNPPGGPAACYSHSDCFCTRVDLCSLTGMPAERCQSGKDLWHSSFYFLRVWTHTESGGSIQAKSIYLVEPGLALDPHGLRDLLDLWPDHDPVVASDLWHPSPQPYGDWPASPVCPDPGWETSCQLVGWHHENLKQAITSHPLSAQVNSRAFHFSISVREAKAVATGCWCQPEPNHTLLKCTRITQSSLCGRHHTELGKHSREKQQIQRTVLCYDLFASVN